MNPRAFVYLLCLLFSSHGSAALLLSDAFSYPDGALVTGSEGRWITHSGSSNELSVLSQAIRLAGNQTEDVNALLTGQPYSGGTNVLYASFTVKMLTLPNGTGSYLSHYKDSSLNFRARIFAFTNSAAPGKFRLGLSSTGSSINATNGTDLSLQTSYRVVTRLVLSNSVSTLWIDPVSESSSSISTTETPSTATVVAYAFRQATGIGTIEVDNLYVGTSFDDVNPELPPIISTQPQGATVYAGANVSFAVSTAGSSSVTYQWQFNGADLVGATNATLTLTNVSLAEAGVYVAILSNGAGSVTSDPAVLTVNAPLSGTSAFSLVHYNVKGNFAADWSTNAPQVQAIARQLLFLNPDIVAFNEVPNGLRHEMTNWIKAFFPAYNLAVSPGTDGAIRGAVMSRFSITRSNSWLDGASLTNFGYNGLFTRDLFEAEIAVPGFPHPLHVFTTHLKSGQATDESNRRAAEARAISNYFVAGFLTTNGSHPYLLTGDMNEDIARPPSSNPKSIQTMISSPVGLRLTTPLNPYTTNELTHSIQNTNGLTKRYDYILPSGILFSNIASSEVFRTDMLPSPPAPLQTNDSVLASDHLPVVMVFNNPYPISPAIITQPQSQTKTVGSSVQFHVTANGSEPISYQWKFNGTNLSDGARVSGATDYRLILSQLTTNDSGYYSVEVSNVAGTNLSATATLTVNVQSNIVLVGNVTASPSQSVPLGSNATFTVETDSPASFSYQWQFNGQAIAGATDSSYTITNAQNTHAGNYSVILSDEYSTGVAGPSTLTVTWIGNPFTLASGFYNGLFYEANGVTHQSSGFITLNVKSNAAFSGKLQLDGDSFAFAGRFGTNGMTNRVISRVKKGKTDLAIDLKLQFGNQILEGTLSSAGWIANIQADKAVYNSVNLATNFSGKYTMIIPGSTNALMPAGHGYALISVRTNGKVTLAGFTAEKAAAKQAVAISKDGIWPLYSALYPGRSIVTNSGTVITNRDFKGSLLGWMTFSGSPSLQLNGTLSWIKTGWTNVHYPEGFTNAVDVIGSFYLPPPKGERAIAVTNGFVSLSDGGLFQPIVRDLFLRTNNTTVITPTNNHVKLSIMAASGLFSGSFIADGSNQATVLKGVVLQQQNYGAGYFLGTNLSGSVLLVPE